jgi:hypothetical protein
VEYKLKVPSEIFAFDISADGNHYSLGLNDSSLIVKSKQQEKATNEEDEEAKIYARFAPQLKKTSKDYKYFNRG